MEFDLISLAPMSDTFNIYCGKNKRFNRLIKKMNKNKSPNRLNDKQSKSKPIVGLESIFCRKCIEDIMSMDVKCIDEINVETIIPALVLYKFININITEKKHVISKHILNKNEKNNCCILHRFYWHLCIDCILKNINDSKVKKLRDMRV